MWISFLIPKIEDGNNFGVSIQEDTLAEIRTVESEAAAFFDQISRYFITRGKIVTKVGIKKCQVFLKKRFYIMLKIAR
jgi:proteasome activator subunit 3 (PA28 gamma)